MNNEISRTSLILIGAEAALACIVEHEQGALCGYEASATIDFRHCPESSLSQTRNGVSLAHAAFVSPRVERSGVEIWTGSHVVRCLTANELEEATAHCIALARRRLVLFYLVGLVSRSPNWATHVDHASRPPVREVG